MNARTIAIIAVICFVSACSRNDTTRWNVIEGFKSLFRSNAHCTLRFNGREAYCEYYK